MQLRVSNETTFFGYRLVPRGEKIDSADRPECPLSVPGSDLLLCSLVTQTKLISFQIQLGTMSEGNRLGIVARGIDDRDVPPANLAWASCEPVQ
jgi:hypothetical protein